MINVPTIEEQLKGYHEKVLEKKRAWARIYRNTESGKAAIRRGYLKHLAKRGEYYRTYILKNRDKINQKSRERYKTDPIYREKKLEANRQYYLKSRINTPK